MVELQKNDSWAMGSRMGSLTSKTPKTLWYQENQ